MYLTLAISLAIKGVMVFGSRLLQNKCIIKQLKKIKFIFMNQILKIILIMFLKKFLVNDKILKKNTIIL